MPSRDFSLSSKSSLRSRQFRSRSNVFRNELIRVSCLKFLLVVLLTAICAATPDGNHPTTISTIGATGLEEQVYSEIPANNLNHRPPCFQSNHRDTNNNRNWRWLFGKNRRDDDTDNNDYSCYWKEIRQEHPNFFDDKLCKNSIEHLLKNRLGVLHFGRVKLSSMFDGETNNSVGNNEEEEHPLRTDLWNMNLKWSFLSPGSKIMSRGSRTRKRRLREISALMELHPEGYCRMIEDTSDGNNKDNENSDRLVLGIGRWRKRPWGVTIAVRPLLLPKLSLESAADPIVSQDDGNGIFWNDAAAKRNKNLRIIDEGTEFIFHARNFHWNGFGSNPKLTQGTILLQKQKKKNNGIRWWKYSSWAYSSILPVWPEEVFGENHNDESDVDSSDTLGSGQLDLQRLFDFFNSRNNDSVIGRRWFRPVVGTFSAKGVANQ
mmetsp:Transcript_26424/g.58188  ORF Transcript_26424/g.58188 Transcript_26424/m.58188 type:complete len:433 (+) Transcript_26424:141-1439(+)|eukprot:CAMPEP_0201199126 /NCGR_PEP_ID=MMETSP0851-20130426/158234_1 /ASSEMBLY_ACC=CAM_ASM_000631 /TAXON_ID=183588 /ORGANISM="Pseudo-nitzschia fraudulenta, Strain WWA7" /LENGTH=432 /DNA_ID=CAMNT_0047486477 /DNA_START=128 /DNA_END=1426 /DNA_ORIENTATION=+